MMIDDLHPDDELVTAVLDGEATPDEVAQVERDPMLVARRAEFAEMAMAVATAVIPLGDDVIDDLVATALAAALTPCPADDAVPDATQATSNVVALSTAPPAPRTAPGRWLAVAAVALVALAIPLALALRPESDQDTFASVGSATAQKEMADNADEPSAAAGSDSDSTRAEPGAPSWEASEAADSAARPLPTMIVPTAPAGGLAPWASVPWLGDLGPINSVDGGLAVAAASRVRATDDGEFTPDGVESALLADPARGAALACLADVAPEGTVRSVGAATASTSTTTAAVLVVVINPPPGTTPAGPVVVVVDAGQLDVGLTPEAQRCGTVLGTAPLSP